ncbi:MAG: ATP-dependent 6-phosphofructokinase [Planctomycetota bacterium]|nr:ATP-dependent 6-phosphofructokinase [Planctomycetota bacterium]
MRRSRRILAVFSGGDAPGMNALLRALVRLAVNRYRDEVFVSRDGLRGLVTTCRQQEMLELTNDPPPISTLIHADCPRDELPEVFSIGPRDVGGLAGRGGIVTGAGRCLDFHDEFVRKQVISLLSEELHIDTVIISGGDGSAAATRCLAEESGLQMLFVPASIDNDVAGSEISLGVDTAVNTVMDAVERFTDTAYSHHRVMILEVMGRSCGELTRLAGVASGAEILVTPERGPLTAEKRDGIARRLAGGFDRGRRHGIVLVTEGVIVDGAPAASPTSRLVEHLAEFFERGHGRYRGTEVRASVLGHLQRGGRPTAADRILAVRLAEPAITAAHETPDVSGMISMREGRPQLIPFNRAVTDSNGDKCGEKLYLVHKDLSRHEPHCRVLSQVSSGNIANSAASASESLLRTRARTTS